MKNHGLGIPKGNIVNLEGRGNFFNERFTRKLKEYHNCKVFALVDLYPKIEGCEKPDQVKERLKKWAGGHSDFHPFVAVHDIEAWILGDEEVVRDYLRGLRFTFPHNPEAIDFDRPPKKYLSELFRKCDRNYKETVDGVNLLARIRPDRVASVCPSFKEFWTAITK